MDRRARWAQTPAGRASIARSTAKARTRRRQEPIIQAPHHPASPDLPAWGGEQAVDALTLDQQRQLVGGLGSMAAAARILRISRRALYKRLRAGLTRTRAATDD